MHKGSGARALELLGDAAEPEERAEAEPVLKAVS